MQVSLQSGNTREIVRLLLEDKVSLGLIEGPARDRGVHVERFMEDELVLITPPNFESDQLSCRETRGVNASLARTWFRISPGG